MRTHLLFAWAMVASLAACGSDSSPGTDAAVASDAHADAGSACTDLSLTGPVVVVSEQVGATPTGTGGTLVDGTYVTTAEVHYRASTSDPTSTLSNLRETVVVTGATAAGASGAYVFEPKGNDAETQPFQRAFIARFRGLKATALRGKALRACNAR